MEWTDLVLEATGVLKVFGKAPSIDNVRLQEASLNWNGPSLEIRFDLADYPANPPTEWVIGQCNRVQLSLACFGLREIAIRRWGTQNQASLMIGTAGPTRVLEAIGDDVDIRLSCDFIYIRKLSVYLDGGNEQPPNATAH